MKEQALKSDPERVAKKVRDVADAMFVVANQSDFETVTLRESLDTIKMAAKHNCLHVVREKDIPVAAVFIALVDDQTKDLLENANAALIGFTKWISGKNKVVISVFTLNQRYQDIARERAQKVLDDYPLFQAQPTA